MSKNLYDVYDLNDNLVIKAMTSDEIAKALDVSVRHVSKCEIECKKLKSKYKIVKSEQEYNSMNTVEKIIRVKWDEARKPFLNVEWVKEMAPGVKRLIVRR